ncbi:MAG: autotransporter outer membrane beta-barrel domain-containing protein [Magnetococcales bacterium]|nr:autotransporter outer membrane beta-barrel domain-containing protein [Magnetococcales bacterium]MBF0321914.1 autotransporter outer membrane beta-barrel domain-containing protein [Magnetococcales bacterium]
MRRFSWSCFLGLGLVLPFSSAAFATSTTWTNPYTNEVISYSPDQLLQPGNSMTLSGNKGTTFTSSFDQSGTLITFTGQIYTENGLYAIPAGCTYNTTTGSLSSACPNVDIFSKMYGPSSSSSSSSSALSHYPSTEVVAPQELRTAVTQTTNQIANRVATIIRGSVFGSQRSRQTGPQASLADENKAMASLASELSSPVGRAKNTFDGNVTGVAAGSAPGGHYGLWTNGSYTSASDDSVDSNSRSGLGEFLLGGDIKLNPKIVLGLALNAEKMSVNTYFNNGRLKSEGFGVTPYAGYKLNDSIYFSMLLGYTNLKYDQKVAGVNSSPRGDRYFYTIRSDYYQPLDAEASLNLYAGLVGASETLKAYTDNAGTSFNKKTTRLNQFNTGIELARVVANRFEPFANAGFEYDFSHTTILGQSYDTTGYRFGAGVRIDINDSLKGEVSAAAGIRANSDDETIAGNLRYEF